MDNKRLLNVGFIVLVDMLGFGSGLESLTRVVIPAAASSLLGAYGTSVPGWMASIVMVFVVVYAYLNLVARRKEIVVG